MVVPLVQGLLYVQIARSRRAGVYPMTSISGRTSMRMPLNPNSIGFPIFWFPVVVPLCLSGLGMLGDIVGTTQTHSVLGSWDSLRELLLTLLKNIHLSYVSTDISALTTFIFAGASHICTMEPTIATRGRFTIERTISSGTSGYVDGKDLIIIGERVANSISTRRCPRHSLRSMSARPAQPNSVDGAHWPAKDGSQQYVLSRPRTRRVRGRWAAHSTIAVALIG